MKQRKRSSPRRQSRKCQIMLRLYIVGQSPNSVRALNQIRSICHTHLRGRFDLEIVDIAKEPVRALADGMFVTPTLVKISPRPRAKIVGDLSQPEKVLLALGIG